MSLSSRKILHRLYPEAAKPALPAAPQRRALTVSVAAGWVVSWVRHVGVVGLCAIVVLTVWLYGVVRYYNTLVAMKSKAEGDWADTLVVMQERHHIMVNLARVVGDYAQHERDLLTKITELRVGPVQTTAGREAVAATAEQDAKKGVAPAPDAKNGNAGVAPQPVQVEKLNAKQLEALFARIQLVAEQYPQLKLTENFQQFSAAIIETEHKIAEHLILYNGDVNAYMTVRTQFPGNHFAWLFGFEPMEFFTADPAELQFREVHY